MKGTMKIGILAGSHVEFLRLQDERVKNGDLYTEYYYIKDREDIMGRGLDCFEVVGTYFERVSEHDLIDDMEDFGIPHRRSSMYELLLTDEEIQDARRGKTAKIGLRAIAQAQLSKARPIIEAEARREADKVIEVLAKLVEDYSGTCPLDSLDSMPFEDCDAVCGSDETGDKDHRMWKCWRKWAENLVALACKERGK